MVKRKNSLAVYTKRRNFVKTSEPAPKKTPKKILPKQSNTLPIFTIQEHHASHLHWDLRLEIDGVMPSWALPKGPSLNSKVKRLAVQTEDHPLGYATFEGTIPAGEYGAGTVMVWDYGTYENIRRKDGALIPMRQCLQDNRMEFVLYGKKLHGAFVLIKIKNNWLFFKKNDTFASTQDITATETRSALTNRTIEEIQETS